ARFEPFFTPRGGIRSQLLPGIDSLGLCLAHTRAKPRPGAVENAAQWVPERREQPSAPAPAARDSRPRSSATARSGAAHGAGSDSRARDLKTLYAVRTSLGAGVAASSSSSQA